jgi:3'-phosphoadenosine 5'-phosphosulfate sulfotransferase (PAPS reductase)/FAD synthetase
MESKHIVMFSGGKDSTALLLKMIELNMQIDEIISVDTGVEFPEMYNHIKKVENFIKQPITIFSQIYQKVNIALNMD